MTFDDLLQVDLKEEDERKREQEALRAANELPLEGTCPQCQCSSGIMTIGHTMFSFCIEHKCYWHVRRLERDYKDEQRARWNEIGLDDYAETKGWVTGMRRTAGNS